MITLSITPRDIRYRLFRLRRLIFIATLIPILGMVLSILITREASWFSNLPVFLGVAFIWFGIVATHSVIFPFDWLEQLSAAIIIAIVVFAGSYLEKLVYLAPETRWGDAGVWLTFIVIFGSIFAFLALVSLLATQLPKRDMGVMRYKARHRAKVAMGDLMQAILLKENTQTSFCSTGPKREDGIFTVTYHYIMPNSRTYEPEPSDFEMYAEIQSKTETSQITQYYMLKDDNEAGVSLCEEYFSEEGAYTTYVIQEQHTLFTLYTVIPFWLCDSYADHFTGAVDFVQGTKPRALHLLPKITALSILARWFARQNFDEHP